MAVPVWRQRLAGVGARRSPGCRRGNARHILGKGDPVLAEKDIILAGIAYRRGEYIANLTRTTGIDGTSDLDLTRAEVAERLRVFEATRALRQVPGFEHSYLISTAPQVGIRESRRIVGEYVLTKEDCLQVPRPLVAGVHDRGEYVLTKEDCLQGRKFPDDLARGAYPIDIHDPEGGPHYFMFIKGGESYGIPYRCCVPRDLDGLLVAGRAISTTHEALGSVCNQATAMAIGHGVGTAAALAARQRCRPRDLDTDVLRRTLNEQGAVV